VTDTVAPGETVQVRVRIPPRAPIVLATVEEAQAALDGDARREVLVVLESHVLVHHLDSPVAARHVLTSVQ